MSRTFLSGALATCLFLLVAGAKWATFERFGSPMPDWDQWDAEAMEVFVPWFENDQFPTHLFNPHNEHRVVLTKLQNLALGLLNGQWDSRLEAVTNALLHAALAAAFWLAACRWSAGRWHAPLFLITLVLFGLPLAWQNVLGGFHSQQYWLLGLSFAAIVLLPFARFGTARWGVGAAAAGLALGSMGSGFLAAAVVLLVVAWRLWGRETSLRQSWPTLVAMGAFVLIGLLTRVEVPWHANLKAKTVHDFIFSIIHSLQWPLRDHDWAALVLWLPWLLVGLEVVRSRADRRPAPAESALRAESAASASSVIPQTLLALGGWVLVQIVATAYARGAGADYPASRYMDTLVFGAMANAAALAWLLTPGRAGTAARLGRGLIAVLWLGTLGLGLKKLVPDILGIELPDAKKYYLKAEGHMRRYLATNDPAQLAHPDIPFPSAPGLIERLARPSLRALMPIPIRAPLPLTPAAAAGSFVENDARGAHPDFPPRAGISPATPPLDAAVTWGSFNPAGGDGRAAAGEWRSGPLWPRVRGWLKFETAGQLGEPGVTLDLVDAVSGQHLASVRPSRVPGDSWRAAYVPAPREPFVIVARDTDAARWLAFSGPTEMGVLSYWASRVTKHGLLVVYFAAGASLVLGGVAVATRARR